MKKLKDCISISPMAEIICNNCDVVSEVYLEGIGNHEKLLNEADEFFFKEGWKMMDGKVLCATCVIDQRKLN